MFNGNSLSLTLLADGLAELCFDRRGEAMNKFDRQTTDELGIAVGLIAQSPQLRGVLVSSAKDNFIVGADISEFEQRFRAPEHQLARSLWQSNEIFMAFEDLPVPSVVALNGHALGGGCELALTAAFRVMADDASIGVPEVKLGLFPGFGGTVRLPRVGGPAVAIEWIARGGQHGAQAAHASGVVDATCPPAGLRELALAWLRRAAAGELDWRSRQAAKRASVPMPPAAHADLFSRAADDCAAQPDAAHQPAAAMAVALMARTTLLPRAAAQWQECEAFAKVARTQAGRARVQAFIDERAVNRTARGWARHAPAPLRVAVHGSQESGAWLRAGDRLSLVTLTEADLVLVPGGGDPQCLRLALAAARTQAAPAAAIACVTSGLRTPALDDELLAGEAVVRLNFYERAGTTGLLEVVRGPSTCDAAVARAVGFALALREVPVVVNQADSLLVERVLSPARAAWTRLMGEGLSPRRLHAALLAFGWTPPCCVFAQPAAPATTATTDAAALADADIVAHLLLPMIVAASTALEQQVVGSAAELDLAMRLAAGLPAHVGGPLQYADWLGLHHVIERLEAHPSNPRPTPAMREMARAGHRYHQQHQKETPA